jgi:thiol:disulfide interchange protein DsbD
MKTARPMFLLMQRHCRAALLALASSMLGLAPALAQAQTPFATGAVVTTPQVKAELLAHAPEGVSAGKPLWLGLKLQHAPHWHTYWKNPGDSGLPTTMEWQLPPGVQAGEIEWPTPAKLPLGPLLNFGYEGTLLLPVAVTVPAGFSGDTLDVKLRADWLVCKDVCIPEGGDFTLRVPVQAATAGNGAIFEAARALVPQPAAGGQARATVEGDVLVLKVSGLPAAWQGKAISYFPETTGVINNAAKPEARWDGSTWTARVPLDTQRSASPATLPSVLVAEGVATGTLVQVAVAGTWPAVAALATTLPPPIEDTVITSTPITAASASSLGWALLAALVGGALLNLMPCVFPVLSLKVMGFAGHAHDRRALLAGGLAYTAGVVLSFVALAGLLLALRSGGEQLGWGFQLQSPAVVASLAALFTLIGLNLTGVFELGSVLPSSLAAARARHPVVDSALTGVLAVAVASPCTAPFMGASLGLAVTLPTAEALSVFAALGFGMALPYLAASAWPRVAQAMPRPGVWMSHFKTLMAFPMFATVVWLVWVLGQQVGIDGAAALLLLLVALAFAAWALGSPGLGTVARRGFGTAAVLLMAATLFWVGPSLRQEAVAAPGATGSTVGANDAWQPWSVEKVAQARAEGRPVFVDFTAAWCVSCQFNKRTTLSRDEVMKDFDQRKVLLLRADWTSRDAAITAELGRLGRNGVPVYALYAPGAAEPQLLSEILSVDEVRTALAALPPP